MIIERNYSIDSLKLICALLVVFIHCDYPYKPEFLPITEVAVPMFFCISGYFLYGAKRNWGRIGRIARIFAWCAAIYLAKTEIFHLLTLHKPWIPTLHDITNFVFFNDVAFSIHLWYLPAYIYVLFIAYFIDKYNLWKTSFYAIVPLLLVGVYVKYSISDLCPEQIQYYRNAYFDGLPYFLVGAWVKSVTPPWRILYINKLRLLMSSAVITLFVVRYLLGNEGFMLLALREMDLLLLTCCIFLLTTLCIQHQDSVISSLGRRYSLYIYIFHVLIMSVCEMVATHLPATINNVYVYINPLCVFILSIALTYTLGKLKIIKV